MAVWYIKRVFHLKIIYDGTIFFSVAASRSEGEWDGVEAYFANV